MNRSFTNISIAKVLTLCFTMGLFALVFDSCSSGRSGYYASGRKSKSSANKRSAAKDRNGRIKSNTKFMTY